MSYKDAANALNARFGTAYSRSSALGRARRMGLGETERSKAPTLPNAASLVRPRERLTADDFRPREFFLHPPPTFQPDQPVQLRCVEVSPRRLSLVELEPGDCRFPYGGDRDGEAITFCAHPRRRGSSYCAPHFHLSRNPEGVAARAVSGAPLKPVDVI